MIEIIFKPIENFDNKYIELKKYATIITNLNIFGKGIEHDNTHYVEGTYFKWKKDNFKMKLYWDDYTENTFCLDIFLDDKEKITFLINKLKSKIENIKIKE